MSFSLIAAVSKNMVIGKDNKLPWDIPEDAAYFYQEVKGKPVVMGRRTYESLGEPIKDSENIILSHDESLKMPGCLVLHSVQQVLDYYRDFQQEVMIIGGAPIYSAFLPFANRLYLTFIDQEVEGNVYFSKWPKDEWEIVSERRSAFGPYSYAFTVLERINK